MQRMKDTYQDLQKVNDLDPQLGTSVPGMTNIIAYTLGESGYTDLNGNGMFDVGEPFVSLAEAFLDDNDDGVKDFTEEFFDFDNDRQYEAAAPSLYQGTLCSDGAKSAGHCAEFVHVRDSVRIVQSNHYDVNITLYEETAPGVYAPSVPVLGLAGTFYVLLQDNNGNIPANGTDITVNGQGYDIYSISGTMPTSTGELDATGAMGLPSYGFFFPVTYVQADDPKAVTVVAELNGIAVSVSLFP